MSGLCLCRVRERLEERGSQGHQMEVFSRVIKKGVGGKEEDGSVREGFGVAGKLSGGAVHCQRGSECRACI